jgi:hypothetical protein
MNQSARIFGQPTSPHSCTSRHTKAQFFQYLETFRCSKKFGVGHFEMFQKIFRMKLVSSKSDKKWENFSGTNVSRPPRSGLSCGNRVDGGCVTYFLRRKREFKKFFLRWGLGYQKYLSMHSLGFWKVTTKEKLCHFLTAFDETSAQSDLWSCWIYKRTWFREFLTVSE